MTRVGDRPVFFITHLYPDKLNIYGDMGNIHALRYRLEKYGFVVEYQAVSLKQALPEKTDLYFIGGGQDAEQVEVFEDLQTKKEGLLADVESGIPLLAICGGYQLLGKTFLTGNGEMIDGIGLFDIDTRAPDATVKSRCIGNLIINCEIQELKDIQLVGFENHGGQTFITDEKRTSPLGTVVVGHGNSYRGAVEGAVYKNAIGTYLHGSCLPKNPELADYLLFKSFRRKAEKNEINPQFYLDLRKKNIDDSLALLAKEAIIKRFSTQGK